MHVYTRFPSSIAAQTTKRTTYTDREKHTRNTTTVQNDYGILNVWIELRLLRYSSYTVIEIHIEQSVRALLMFVGVAAAAAAADLRVQSAFCD